VTKAQLEAEVERLHRLNLEHEKLIATQLREITRLHTQGGTVPQAEYDALLVQLRKANERLDAYRQVRHNTRGAGRKPYDNTEVIGLIRQWRDEGLSYSAIVERLDRSEYNPPSARTWARSTVYKLSKIKQ